jgi:hypothetical protein
MEVLTGYPGGAETLWIKDENPFGIGAKPMRVQADGYPGGMPGGDPEPE